jgi:hypothetical protein
MTLIIIIIIIVIVIITGETKFTVLKVPRQCPLVLLVNVRCKKGKTMSITYYERVCVTLVIQHAKRMRHIILSYVSCLNL